jgi:hypothetical protein
MIRVHTPAHRQRNKAIVTGSMGSKPLGMSRHVLRSVDPDDAVDV